MKNVNIIIRNVASLVLLSLLPACTHLEKVSVQPTTLSDHSKLPAKAALVLDDALMKYQFESRMMGDKWVFPFGPALKDYAQHISENCFAQVTTYPSIETATDKDADLILHPKALKAEQAMGLMAWSDRKFTLQVEWIARDRSNKNTVWLQTFTAEGVNSSGNAFTGSSHQKILFQRLFDDLSLKTVEAIQNSPELKAISAGSTPINN